MTWHDIVSHNIANHIIAYITLCYVMLCWICYVILHSTSSSCYFFLSFFSHLLCLVDLKRLSRLGIMSYHVISFIHLINCDWVLCAHMHLLLSCPTLSSVLLSFTVSCFSFPFLCDYVLPLPPFFLTRFHPPLIPSFLTRFSPFSSFSFLTRFSPLSSFSFLTRFLPLSSFSFLTRFHHPGDTPNCITDAEFESMGEVSEGYSGSDIAIVVRQVEERRGGEMNCYAMIWYDMICYTSYLTIYIIYRNIHVFVLCCIICTCDRINTGF